LVFVIFFIIPVLIILVIAAVFPLPRPGRTFKKDDKIWVAHRPKRPAVVNQWWPPKDAATMFPNGIIGAAKPPYIDGVIEASFVGRDAFGREYPKEIAAGTSIERR
jgi:hypothetical protein